jgi:hypothetical protein
MMTKVVSASQQPGGKRSWITIELDGYTQSEVDRMFANLNVSKSSRPHAHKPGGGVTIITTHALYHGTHEIPGEATGVVSDTVETDLKGLYALTRHDLDMVKNQLPTG